MNVQLIRVRWDAVNIVLSVFIAFIGSYACITLYEQYRSAASYFREIKAKF